MEIRHFATVVLLQVATLAAGQTGTDPVADSIKNQILGRFSNLTVGFYIDAYSNMTLYDQADTSNIVPYAGNCPIRDQIRLNVAAMEMYYNAEKVRGKFAIQFGDAPNLLASNNAQWTKNIRQANFGFRIVKDLWADFGYIFNPIGYESAWPVLNQISFITIGGYFEPGSILGAKLSYRFSPKFIGGIMAGNPFSLAYSHNNNTYGLLFFTYTPWENLSITYNNMFGNRAIKSDSIREIGIYNNLIITYKPWKFLELAGQLDYGVQTNGGKPPDTTAPAMVFSGFLQARYVLNTHFSATARYEWFNDPDGALSGLNIRTNRGVRTNGFDFSFEYKPLPIGYIRLAYRYIGGYPGSMDFISHTSDDLQAIIVTTGVRF